MTERLRILAIDGSPTGGGRTHTVLRTVLAAAEAAGAETSECSLAHDAPSTSDELIADMGAADALVVGSPIYRASYATPLKTLLDITPRGMWGETEAPLRGKAIVLVATGASLHHFLALDDFRNVLAGFFAAHVLPPGLYVPREGFADGGMLGEPYASQAVRQGQALVELALALRATVVLRQLTPQA